MRPNTSMKTALTTQVGSINSEQTIKRSFNCDTLNCKQPVFMPLIGYARVSTEDQTPLPQSEALQTVGCVEIHEEHASGGNRARPVLARLLERISKGDTLVVVRIDRLARSLSHLL